MSNIEERKLALLETLVKDQKLLIEQIRNLNNNVLKILLLKINLSSIKIYFLKI